VIKTSKWQNQSLGLGDLLDRARAVIAVQDAMERGEFRKFMGEPVKLSKSSASRSRDAGDHPKANGTTPRIDPGQRLLSVDDVADALQLKASTVRAYAERGSMSCVRVGNRLRFRPSDVDLWIEQRHSKGGS
jgi:excisionase family DNA binding protein